jgi:hypothetical protein
VTDSAIFQRRRRLDRSFNGILLLIAVEFFLGIWLNLFGSFTGAGSSIPQALSDTGAPVLVAHIVVGVVLLLGAIIALVLSWGDPNRALRWFALGGLLAIVIAGSAGNEFVMASYSNNYASFGMAVGFAAALTAYYEGLIVLRARPLPRELMPAEPPVGQGTA